MSPLIEKVDADKSRRIAAAARLLLSDKPGEVAGAVQAIGRMLPDGVTVPDLVERAITPSPAKSPIPTFSPAPRSYAASWKHRARIALACPHLTKWERGFLRDVVNLSTLTAKQERCLARLLTELDGRTL